MKWVQSVMGDHVVTGGCQHGRCTFERRAMQDFLKLYLLTKSALYNPLCKALYIYSMSQSLLTVCSVELQYILA